MVLHPPIRAFGIGVSEGGGGGGDHFIMEVYTGIITIYRPAMHYILVKTAQELWPVGWLRGCFFKA